MAVLILLVTIPYILALEPTVTRSDYEKDFKGGQYLNDTYFGKLKNFHIGANQITNYKHKFVARVIHSIKNKYPVICTAACVHHRIFLTAARCVYNAVPQYTSVIFWNYKLSVAGFTLPTYHTKQLFDDVAFVVVNYGYPWDYDIAKFYDSYIKRTDDRFGWLDYYRESVYDYYDHTVIGYATDWENVKDVEAMNNTNYNLTELTVFVGTRYCAEILPAADIPQLPSTFHVPCYLSCTLNEHKVYGDRCRKYHGVEGGIVWNAKKERIVGIATWGVLSEFNEDDGRSTPVGYAVPSGRPFADAFRCAKGVVKVGSRDPGVLQKACDAG